MILSFEEFNLVFYGSERLACFERTRQWGFWRHLRYFPYNLPALRSERGRVGENPGNEVAFRTLWSKKTTFLKGNFCILKVSWTVSTFWHRSERKTTKCAFEIDFLPCARPILLAWTQWFNLSYANCFLGLTYGFLNKNFQEIKPFICHCSFHNISSKNDHETTDREIFRNIQTDPFLN